MPFDANQSGRFEPVKRSPWLVDADSKALDANPRPWTLGKVLWVFASVLIALVTILCGLVAFER